MKFAKYFAISGRDLTPVYSSGGTGSDGSKWYLVDGSIGINSHQSSVPYANAIGAGAVYSKLAITGVTIPSIIEDNYDVYAYLKSFNAVGAYARVNGGNWSAGSGASGSYSWVKLGTFSIKSGDLLEITEEGGSGGGSVIVMDLCVITAGAKPNYTPTGKEGSRIVETNITLPEKMAGFSAMKIGDYIECEYTAQSGVFGSFANIGKATKAFIPAASSATPDGKLKFICVGYDMRGRMKLIADRNIQHSISWDALNVAGLCSSSGVPVAIDGKNYTMRLMTGGINGTETENEWNKIIAESTLNGTISAGSADVWNWSPVASFILERNTNAMSRGSQTVTSFYNNVATSAPQSSWGLRPVLLVDVPKAYYMYLKEDYTAHAYTAGAVQQVAADWRTTASADKKAFFLMSAQEVAPASLLQALGKYKVLKFSPDVSANKPSGAVLAVPNAQLVLPKTLLPIVSFEGIDKITITAVTTGAATIKVICTTDGKIFKTWNGTDWVTVDQTDKAAVSTNGLTIAQLNALDRAAWDKLTAGKMTIGFGALVDIAATSETCAIDKTVFTVDMKGSWNKAVHGTDYDYGYPQNNILRVSLKTTGDYKINYSEGALNV